MGNDSPKPASLESSGPSLMWRSTHDLRKILVCKYQHYGPTRKCTNHYEVHPNIETTLFLYPMNTKQSYFPILYFRKRSGFLFPYVKTCFAMR